MVEGAAKMTALKDPKEALRMSRWNLVRNRWRIRSTPPGGRGLLLILLPLTMQGFREEPKEGEHHLPKQGAKLPNLL